MDTMVTFVTNRAVTDAPKTVIETMALVWFVQLASMVNHVTRSVQDIAWEIFVSGLLTLHFAHRDAALVTSENHVSKTALKTAWTRHVSEIMATV